MDQIYDVYLSNIKAWAAKKLTMMQDNKIKEIFKNYATYCQKKNY